MINKKNSCHKEKLAGTRRNTQDLGNLSLLFIWGLAVKKHTVLYILCLLPLPLLKHSISAKAQLFLQSLSSSSFRSWGKKNYHVMFYSILLLLVLKLLRSTAVEKVVEKWEQHLREMQTAILTVAVCTIQLR